MLLLVCPNLQTKRWRGMFGVGLWLMSCVCYYFIQLNEIERLVFGVLSSLLKSLRDN